jgi:hypothetical protein
MAGATVRHELVRAGGRDRRLQSSAARTACQQRTFSVRSPRRKRHPLQHRPADSLSVGRDQCIGDFGLAAGSWDRRADQIVSAIGGMFSPRAKLSRALRSSLQKARGRQRDTCSIEMGLGEARCDIGAD